jgi:hypothetical protein
MRPGTRAVALGAGASLALALPATPVAQVLEALRDDGTDAGPVVYLLAGLVLIGMAVGGVVVGRQRPTRPAASGALAGLAAIVVVLALGVARRLAAGDHVAWGTVPAPIGAAAGLAAVASTLTTRAAGRKRP